MAAQLLNNPCTRGIAGINGISRFSLYRRVRIGS
jgi:hypothetical protein